MWRVVGDRVHHEILSAIWDVWLFNSSGWPVLPLPGQHQLRVCVHHHHRHICSTSIISSGHRPSTEPGRCSRTQVARDHGPLVVLHDHLDGEVRPSTVLDLIARSVSPPAGRRCRRSTRGVDDHHAGDGTRHYVLRFDLVNAGLQSHADALRRVARRGSKILRPTAWSTPNSGCPAVAHRRRHDSRRGDRRRQRRSRRGRRPPDSARIIAVMMRDPALDISMQVCRRCDRRR